MAVGKELKNTCGRDMTRILLFNLSTLPVSFTNVTSGAARGNRNRLKTADDRN